MNIQSSGKVEFNSVLISERERIFSSLSAGMSLLRDIRFSRQDRFKKYIVLCDNHIID